MALKHVILLVLHRGDVSGYDITKEFDDMLSFFWHASHQQVYRELAKLTNEGLVSYTIETQIDKPDKKVYHLNEKGLEQLEEWLTTPFEPKNAKDDLLIRLLGHDIISAEELQKIMLKQTNIHQQKLAQYLEIEKGILAETPLDKMSPEFRILCLPLRRGIYAERAWLEWAKEVNEALTFLDHSRKSVT